MRVTAAGPGALLATTLLLAGCTGGAGHGSTGGTSTGGPPSPTPTSSPHRAPTANLPVYLQSHDGSAVTFTLPAGWHQTSATRTSATYGISAQPKSRVTVSWQIARLTSLGLLAADAKVRTAQTAGKAYKFACNTTPETGDVDSGSIVDTFETPCGRSGARSVFVPATVPVQPAPPGGRTQVSAAWLASPTQEEWSVLYSAPEADVDRRVTNAVVHTSLQVLRAKSVFGQVAIGSGPPVTAVALPHGLGTAADIAVPAHPLPGASATDACTLVTGADVAHVPQMPAYGSTSRPSVRGKPSIKAQCDLTFADREKASLSGSPPFSGTLTVQIRNEPIKTAGGALRGTVAELHGVGSIAGLEQDTKTADFNPEVLLAAGPMSTVAVSYAGQANDFAGWEQLIAAAAADQIAERIATGKLARAPSITNKPQRGRTATGIQYGTAHLSATQSSLCGLVPDLAALMHSKIGFDSSYPPSCRTDTLVNHETPAASIFLYDGHALGDEIDQHDVLLPGGPGDSDVYTQLRGCETVVTSQRPVKKDTSSGFAIYSGRASAALGVSPVQWVELEVEVNKKSEFAGAVNRRDKLVAQIIAHTC